MGGVEQAARQDVIAPAESLNETVHPSYLADDMTDPPTHGLIGQLLQQGSQGGWRISSPIDLVCRLAQIGHPQQMRSLLAGGPPLIVLTIVELVLGPGVDPVVPCGWTVGQSWMP